MTKLLLSILFLFLSAASAFAQTYIDATNIRTWKVWLKPAVCTNATTAATLWDLPTTTPATPACVAGTNILKGVLDFADGGVNIAQVTIGLPADWTTQGGVSMDLFWTTPATTGNAKWNVAIICTAVGATATDDAAFQAADTVTTAAPGTTLRVQTSSIAALTLTSSLCTTATRLLLHIKISRDGTDAADTIGDVARLIGAKITYRRTITP